MSISNYVNKLLPIFKKGDMEKHIANLRKELAEDTMPPLIAIDEIMNKHVFKDKWCLSVDALATHKLNTRYRGNYISKIRAILEKNDEKLAKIENLLAKHKGRDIVISSITYSQLQIFQLLDAIAFTAKYTRTLLVYTMAVETEMLRQNKNVRRRMTKAELDMLKDRRDVFFDVLGSIDMSAKAMSETISNVPEIEIDVNRISVDIAASGITALDPFGMARQGLILSPIYHVRMMLADWEDHRRQLAYEERIMLQHQILDLKAAMEGREDANLQKAIDYSEKRLNKLNYKIAKMEEV